MKRVFGLGLTLCLLLALCACGGNEGKNNDANNLGGETHTHTFGEWTQTTAPSCSEKGGKRRSCDCGYEEVREIPALGHVLTLVSGKNATYDAGGLLMHWVCECGALFFDVAGLNPVADEVSLKLDKLVHVEVTEDVIQNAIQEAGQKEIVALPTIPTPVNASVGSVKIPVNAMKTVADVGKALAVETEQATVLLDKTVQETIAEKAGKSEFVTIEVVQITPDAMNQAQKESVKDKAVALVLSAQVIGGGKTISHFDGGTATVQIPFTIPEDKDASDFSVVYIADDGAVETIPSTYRDGKLVVELEHFSHYAVMEKPKHTHRYKTTVTEHTCLEKGFTTYTCDDCGHFYRSDAVEAKGHSFGKWHVAKEPSCTQKGDEKRTCACGKAETRELPAKGHSFGDWVVLEKAIQCEKDGYKERTCTCGEKEGVSISCHNFGKWTVCQKPVKCLEDGYENRVCSCGAEEGHFIPCHKNSVVVKVVVPNCYRNGYTEFYCNDCGTTYTGEIKEALGHVFSDWSIEQESVHGVTEGLKKRSCSRCGGTFREPISVHPESDWIVDKVPTKTEDGSKHTECTVCGIVIQQKVLYGGSAGLKWYALVGPAVGDDGKPVGMGEAQIRGKGICKDVDVVIPQYIDDGHAVFKVVEICPESSLVDNVGVFEGYSALQSVVVPEGVTKIWHDAFKNCGLKRITLPSTLTSIGWDAFRNTNLSEIHFNGTKAQWEAIQKEEFAPELRYTVYCTDGEIAK